MNAYFAETRRPWHESEIGARQMAGKPEIAPVIRSYMSEQLRAFFPRLPLVFVAGLDVAGKPAASFLRGVPGFITCPDPQRLEIAAALPRGDPLAQALRPGAPFGLIGLDFSARRRNRVNGRIIHADAEKISLVVEEAFGNCPKYIFPRQIFAPRDTTGEWSLLPALGAPERDLIARADVFFIATRGPDGVDISHRGGRPGFVTISSAGALQIPDYRGNNYFNSFGNLLYDPSAALLFVDFAKGVALHLSGQARIDFSREDRLWTFAPNAIGIFRTNAPFGTVALAPAPEA